MSELTAESIPNEISKQLGPYLKRSLELLEFKPIVSYYCKFYITDYIINNKLHLSSTDVSNFTLLLLDDMEQCKSRLSEEELHIMQDSALSYKHVEEFAFSIFHKGYLDIINHTTTKATVGVLKNAIEFMTILKYWGEPLKPEVLKNIKYAKFHISRILKAYRSNQDPNDYMTPEDKDLEKNLDTELLELSHATEDSPHPSLPTFQNNNSTKLPSPPTFIDQDNPVELPSPPSLIKGNSASELPQPPSFINDPEDILPSQREPENIAKLSSQQQQQPKSHSNVPSHSKKTTKEDIKSILSTEERISKTQKHCKFAISALNYEDVDTAILELKKALELLQTSDRD